MQLNKEKMALLLALVATLFTGLYVPIVRLLDQTFTDPVEIAGIRSVMCVLIVGITLLIFSRESFRIDKKDIWIFVLFGLVQVGYSLLGIFSVSENGGGLDGGLGAALQSTSPYFTIAIAFFMFKEKITLNKFVAILIGFIGCVMSTGVFTESIEAKILGILMAVGGAFFVAVFNIGSKYTGDRHYSTETTLFYFYLVSAIVMLPFMFVNDTFATAANADGNIWLGILAIGLISTAIPQFLTIKAFQMGDTGKVSVVLMFDIVTTGIFCWLMLKQTMDFIQILGLVLVIVSLVIIELNIGGDKELVRSD